MVSVMPLGGLLAPTLRTALASPLEGLIGRLKAGDKVVIEGQGALRPGATVAPRAPVAAGAKP